MKVLLDECLPRKFKFELREYSIFTVPEMGWSGLKNGELLKAAERSFDVFITADRNVEYQQNLHSTKLGIIVLVAPNNRLETLRPLMNSVRTALPSISNGDILHLSH